VIVVVGANGASLGPVPMAPGTVESAVSGAAFLNEISFLAADAPTADAPLPGRARISPRQLRVPPK
jgi:hypothetical protein